MVHENQKERNMLNISLSGVETIVTIVMVLVESEKRWIWPVKTFNFQN
jgi:hypothetical protein